MRHYRSLKLEFLTIKHVYTIEWFKITVFDVKSAQAHCLTSHQQLSFIWRQGHSLKSHPSDWWSRGSYQWLLFTRPELSTPQRLLYAHWVLRVVYTIWNSQPSDVFAWLILVNVWMENSVYTNQLVHPWVQRGYRGSGTHLENHKAKEFHSNTGSDLLEIH